MTTFSVRLGSLTEAPCDALVVNLLQGVRAPGGGTGAVDSAMGGAITELIRDRDFQGCLGDVAVIRSCGAVPAKNVVLVGLGESSHFGPTQIMRASAAAIRTCAELRACSVESILHGAGIAGLPPFDCARAVVLGTILGAYRHTRLKTEDVEPDSLRTFEIVELSADKLDEIERGIGRAELVGEAITFARDLASEPSNVVTPDYLAEVAAKIASEFGMQCRVLDRAAIEREGLGLVAAVARGSAAEPRFIHLIYEYPGAHKAVALVGKGITFDTGGHSIKVGGKMYGMKDDMSGAAAVLAAMRAVGKAKPQVNVHAVIPALENAIGPRAIHPGDVFTSYSGRTVEVANTDAEGRLILADSVAYADKLGVDEIVDVATLTGACVVALGRGISGVVGTNQQLVGQLVAAGARCGEKLWQLPLETDYRDKLKSEIADLKNVPDAWEADALLAALFIQGFAGNTAWAHVDLSASSLDADSLLSRKGPTGAGAGTLVEYLT